MPTVADLCPRKPVYGPHWGTLPDVSRFPGRQLAYVPCQARLKYSCFAIFERRMYEHTFLGGED
ncbi:MAG: hypothetical protein JWP08_2989 [Bryobacterales bacterium]|jgi:hypothetical protein|nr:hypothetical protein [Bryobacterales bacterium]